MGVATIVAAVGLAAMGFVPLFGGPGYEAALAAGVLLPGLAATATALDVRSGQPQPFDAFARGAATGALLAAIGLVLTLLHGLRVGFCAPLEGTEYFVLGPGVGSVMGGVWGAFSGIALERRSRRLTIALALAGPFAGIVTSVIRFYTSPMVFAFDPFFGFFAGTLYDSVITGLGRLLTYRAGSALTIAAAGALAASFARPDLGAVAPSLAFAFGDVGYRFRGRPGLVVFGVAAALGSAVHVAKGPALGHWQTASTIREELGESLVTGRCELVYPTGTPIVEARALAKECDGHLAQLGRFFGVPGPPHVVAFVFANAAQKGELMGAATTYIAKPWRREIYIQRAGFPHPVMRHELAHVVAGGFGEGPFRVSGPLFGLIPDPGRIEGVAVAAAPHDEDLSLDEWAKAMRDLHLLPPLDRVFKLSFFGEPSSRAYVVAGAFIDWLRRTHGIDAVRRWYGGASLRAAAAGNDLAALERDWLASIDGLVIPADVLEVARARFDQPAIFGRRCPHTVDALSEEAGQALAQLDAPRAKKLYRDLLALDPHDVGGRLGLAACALREGKDDEARSLYRAVAADTSFGKAVRARALETLGDIELALGNGPVARDRYDEVAHAVVDEDHLRALDVKRYAADGAGRDAIVAHLVGDLRTGRDPTKAAASLGAWSERDRQLGVAEYLLGRTYLGSGRWELARESFDHAVARQLPIPSVAREADKDRLIVACALGDPGAVLAAYADWSRRPGAREPARAEMAEFVERCTGARAKLAAVPANAAPEGSVSDPPAPRPGPPAFASAAPEGSASDPPAPRPGPPAPASAPEPDAAGLAAFACGEGMVTIPGGEAWIGSKRGDGSADEWPRYRTKFPAFCMDKTEVTVAAYGACVASHACTPADAKRVTCTASRPGHDAYPINCVDFAQATAYCGYRGARLPTEAEWEYAASGGDDRRYAWGDDAPDGRTCWKTNGACPVGSFPEGAFGLLDMTGNVWEWTSDWYGDYPWPPMDGVSKVYRGGSWSRRFDKWMGVRLRNRSEPGLRGSHLGFRCAKTLPDAPCPFGRGEDGACRHGVLAADCREGRTWNGVRCAPPGETGCGEGHHEVPGHGCVRDEKAAETAAPSLDLAGVERARSPEFDADCATFQAPRPHAYRFTGSTHEARTAVVRASGCKNRDVGVGWNSACCP